VTEVNCPRAKTWMTPCIARDGASALTEQDRGREACVCVGCGIDSREALHRLADSYPPARKFLQTKDREKCAARLQEMVAAAYVGVGGP
jgi:hypothetical protein